MLLNENETSVKFCPKWLYAISTREIRKSSIDHFLGALWSLNKNEFEIIKHNFLKNSDHLDKQPMEWFALTATQLKRPIVQSRDKKLPN